MSSPVDISFEVAPKVEGHVDKPVSPSILAFLEESRRDAGLRFSEGGLVSEFMSSKKESLALVDEHRFI